MFGSGKILDTRGCAIVCYIILFCGTGSPGSQLLAYSGGCGLWLQSLCYEQGVICTKQAKEQKHSLGTCCQVLRICLRKIRIHCCYGLFGTYIAWFRLIAMKVSGYWLSILVTRPQWKPYAQHKAPWKVWVFQGHGRWRKREPWRVNK